MVIFLSRHQQKFQLKFQLQLHLNLFKNVFLEKMMIRQLKAIELVMLTQENTSLKRKVNLECTFPSMYRKQEFFITSNEQELPCFEADSIVYLKMFCL